MYDVNLVGSLARAALADAAVGIPHNPHLAQRLEEDLARLINLVETRGVGVLMIDFPKVGKAIDTGLKTGFLPITDLPTSLGSWKRGKYLYQGLLQELFSRNGRLIGEDPKTIRGLRTLFYMWKKVTIPCESRDVKTAIAGFVKTDAALPIPSSGWLGHERPLLDEMPWDVFLEFSKDTVNLTDHELRTIDRCFARLIPGQMLNISDIMPRHGPGSVSDVKRGSDKYTEPTSWSEMAEEVFAHSEFLSYKGTYCSEGIVSPRDLVVPVAKLAAVPKTLDKPRLITVEHSGQQFLQQGLLRWIRQRMTGVASAMIDFSKQDKSRNMALRGSRDGTLATIDLSEASDRLSCTLVELAFKSNPTLLRALQVTRCPYVKVDDVDIQLRKYAGMGNATTFPVQSLIFAGLALAAVLIDSRWWKSSCNYKALVRATKHIQVFGDDIIIPSQNVVTLSRLLTFFGLKINAGKSCVQGLFREACGMDAYAGVDVTPLYIRSVKDIFTMKRVGAEDFASLVDVHKNAYDMGCYHIAMVLASRIPEKFRKLLPIGPHCEYLSLRGECDDTSHLRTRVNRDLQLKEYRVLMIGTKARTRRREDGNASLLQYFLEEPPADLPWSAGYISRTSSTIVVMWSPLL